MVTTSPILDNKGEVIQVINAAKDISKHKEAEEKLTQTLNELWFVNEKLGVVGSLTRHDVRNKLSAVNGYAYLLKKEAQRSA